jgi:hypothetical protein
MLPVELNVYILYPPVFATVGDPDVADGFG